MRRLAIALFVTAIVAAGAAACGSNKSSAPTLDVRKNVKDMTTKEKTAFVNAIVKLKATPSKANPGLSMYDDFVKTHLDAFSCSRRWQDAGAAHNSPLFLPWHRELLLKFQQALRTVSHDKNLTLPYWDWTDPKSTAAVFAPNFMGPDGDPSTDYAVTSGPFARGKWTLNVLDPIEPQKALLGSDTVKPQTNYLSRHFGILVSKTDSLPTTADVNTALGVGQYDAPQYDAQTPANISFRCNLEGWRNAEPPDCIPSTADPAGFMNVDTAPGSPHDLHNGVHLYVGGIWAESSGAIAAGTMIYDTSPNDPVFWLHHANVDRIWSQWETQHPGQTYSPQSGAAQGFNGTDTMWPWHDMTINSLESTKVKGYVYSA